jgi:hypothetical protein
VTSHVVLAIALVAGTAHLVEAQPQPGWEVRVPERVELAEGSSGTLAISLAIDRGLTVSRDAPVILDLDVPRGVTVRRRRLGRDDAVDPEADAPRFAIPVRADAAGDHAVAIRLRFWLCGKQVCRPIDVRRTTTIAIAPASPAEPSPEAGAR